MKLFKKNENKKTTKLPMTGKVKKGFRYYCMAVMAMTFVLGTSVRTLFLMSSLLLRTLL